MVETRLTPFKALRIVEHSLRKADIACTVTDETTLTIDGLYGLVWNYPVEVKAFQTVVLLSTTVAVTYPPGFDRIVGQLQAALGNRFFFNKSGAIVWARPYAPEDLGTSEQVEEASVSASREVFLAQALLQAYGQSCYSAAPLLLGLGDRFANLSNVN